MKIAVVGLGYIGLPTALLLAKNGHYVTGVDIAEEKVDNINQGKLPFEEKGIKKLYNEAKHRFKATTSYDVICDSDVVIVCVPTPVKNRKMDRRYIVSAAENIGKYLRRNTLVILESTVTPGTTEGIFREILEKKSGFKTGIDFYLAYCPERALPGNTIYEMIHNDRVIGGYDEKSAKLAKNVYSSFVKGNIYLTKLIVAEMTKVAENTFRDVNIALANELAKIAEKVGVNVYEVIKMANKHPRVNIHRPGLGVGGHCLPLDPWFLVEIYPDAEIIPIARKINDSMINRVIDIISKYRIKRVVLLGLAYKPNVDDTRESPSIRLSEKLETKGIEVRKYDPLVNKNNEPLEKILDGSQAVIIGTAHNIFKELNWKDIIDRLDEPKLIIDGWNFFGRPPKGAKFYGIGRGDLIENS